jgi:hypothetical protein
MTSVSPNVADSAHAEGVDPAVVDPDETDDAAVAEILDASDDADEADDGFDRAIAQKQREAEDGLSEQQQRMLVFERQWWRHAGSKEQAIREQFNLSATRYYQMLNRLLDNPAALEFDALVVGRLRRLRATRARSRGVVQKPI